MRNHTGSAAWESGMVLTSIPFGVFLILYVTPFLHKKLVLLSEFLVIIFPVILNITTLSDKVYLISLIKFSICILLFFIHFDSENLNQVLDKSLEKHKNCITNYRSSTNFVSVLCILAVDFMIFPRRFAKTESFGFGLMDLGVGFFICANGMIVKNLKSANDFKKILKGSMVLIILGLARLISTKSVDYHQLVSEYGVHWNFFFTLAFCRLFAYFVMVFTNCFNPLFLTIMTGAAHQLLLYVGMQDWIFSDLPRHSLISANREGITSLLGYVSLFFGAVYLGNLVNRPGKADTYRSLLFRLVILSIVGWFATAYAYHTVGISRKLANAGYNLWVLSLTVSVLIQFTLGEIVLEMIYTKTKTKPHVPEIFESINANGLFYFLLGNLMTGLINLTFQTLLLDKWTSIFLITLYKLILCVVAYVFYKKNIIIKFW